MQNFRTLLAGLQILKEELIGIHDYKIMITR